MHLGPADRPRRRQAARQPAQILVAEPRSGGREWRLRGDISLEASTAGVSRAARFRVFSDLPLPSAGARDAYPPGRHRSLQIRRVQTERAYQGDEEPGLLETGAPLSG